jgi:hypothetical protein
MARKSTKSTKVTDEVPAQVPETQTAGNPQDEAEAVNLKTATDTSDTEAIAATEIKAKKERKQKAVKEVKEAKNVENVENVESDDEKPKPKPKAKKEPKAKKVDSDDDEPKAKTPKEPKEKKRAPSAYNLFVKEVMPSLKKENEALDEGKKKTQRDLMKLAAELWNKKKAEA